MKISSKNDVYSGEVCDTKDDERKSNDEMSSSIEDSQITNSLPDFQLPGSIWVNGPARTNESIERGSCKRADGYKGILKKTPSRRNM